MGHPVAMISGDRRKVPNGPLPLLAPGLARRVGLPCERMVGLAAVISDLPIAVGGPSYAVVQPISIRRGRRELDLPKPMNTTQTRSPQPVEICAWSPEWPSLFAAKAKRIRSVLGERALRIDHIGSTAIQGLAAKPIIDIQISVANLHAIEVLKEKMDVIGYMWRPLNGDLTKRYFREAPGSARISTCGRSAVGASNGPCCSGTICAAMCKSMRPMRNSRKPWRRVTRMIVWPTQRPSPNISGELSAVRIPGLPKPVGSRDRPTLEHRRQRERENSAACAMSTSYPRQASSPRPNSKTKRPRTNRGLFSGS